MPPMLTGLLTSADRVVLTHAHDAVNGLSVSGCRDLASHLETVLTQPAPSRSALLAAAAAAGIARSALLGEASPDRWLDLLGAKPAASPVQLDLISTLIADRQAQARRVAEAAEVIARLLSPLPAAVPVPG